MTQDEIIRSPLGREQLVALAREAGSIDSEDVILTVYAAFSAHERNRHAWTQEHWTQYEHAIAAAEREACAKVCEDDMGWLDNGGGELCAKAIRSRSNEH